MHLLERFQEIWCVDFEFFAPDGCIPAPVCLVAKEIRSGQSIRIWEDDLQKRLSPPYPTDKSALFCAYYASAEIGCHLALGWPTPQCVLDLYAEFRSVTNGLALPAGNGLLGALKYYGLPVNPMSEKESMRQLAMRGGPWTANEQQNLLAYCEGDIDALVQLLHCMGESLDLPRALLRGRYMNAAARIEHNGIPVDTEQYTLLAEHWATIQKRLIERVNAEFHVYEGRVFRLDRFEKYLADRFLDWPRTPTGRLSLDKDTFSDQTKCHPELRPLHDLRTIMGEMRAPALAIGPDSRNRTLLSAFGARSGRNTPSTTKNIFGMASWLRNIIRPVPDRAIAYIDWSQQEFAIAAALSNDSAMMAAYLTGDPYLAFAKQAGAIPADGTKESHPDIREMYKTCILGIAYGMGSRSLAQRLSQPEITASQLLQQHKRAYPDFWKWSDLVVAHATLHGNIRTLFGWRLLCSDSTFAGRPTTPRTLRNFPMQANGAEMLRLACCLATEAGIRVCMPVHDALLIEAPTQGIQEAVAATQEVMQQASEIILPDFPLRSEAKIFTYPDHYSSEKGAATWANIQDILQDIGAHTDTAYVQEELW